MSEREDIEETKDQLSSPPPFTFSSPPLPLSSQTSHSLRPALSPLTTLLINHSPLIHIHHLGRSILHGCVRVDVELDLPHLGHGRRTWMGDSHGSEIAKFEEFGTRLKDVFDLWARKRGTKRKMRRERVSSGAWRKNQSGVGKQI